jgi:hypothetical protein
LFPFAATKSQSQSFPPAAVAAIAGIVLKMLLTVGLAAGLSFLLGRQRKIEENN